MVSTSQLRSAGTSREKWYALYVKARYEKTVDQHLQAKGYRGFLPLYKSTHRWSDRFKEVFLPLFPRYIFCHFEIRNRLPILRTPGVVRIIAFSGQPVSIDDREIEAIKAIVNSGLPASPHPFLKAGQRARLVAGPLAGLEGIFMAARGPERLIFSIDMLQRSVAVEIDRRWVLPLHRKASGSSSHSLGIGRKPGDFGQTA